MERHDLSLCLLQRIETGRSTGCFKYANVAGAAWPDPAGERRYDGRKWEARMKNKLELSLLLTALITLGGCATGNQPYSYFGGGGYSDVQLSETVFKVTVVANGYTSADRATNLALLRASELALEHGFKFFVIVAEANNSSSGSYTTPTYTNVQAGAYGATAQTYGGQTYNFTFPSPSITISCFVEKPVLQTAIYDASISSQSLKKQLGVK